MSKETTYAGMLGDWQRLIDPLEANGEDVPHLEAPRAKLAGLLLQAQEITRQQKALTASKQEASQRLKTLLTEGQRLANVLRVSLKEHYGIRSEKLAAFGLQPFRGRKAKPETPGELPPPPTITPEAGR